MITNLFQAPASKAFVPIFRRVGAEVLFILNSIPFVVQNDRVVNDPVDGYPCELA